MNNYFSLLFNGNIDAAEDLRKQSIPKKLIKFFSLNKDINLNNIKFDTLENNKLWFSHYKELNDPYEYKCMFIDREKLKQHSYPDDIINYFEDLLKNLSLSWALVSLSANDFDCLPMWAYYTNNHEGYCVEYDVLKPDAIYRVGYETDRIPIATIISNFYSEFTKMLESKEKTNEELKFYAMLIQQQFFLKHSSWKHENEYRIIYPMLNKLGVSVPIENIGLRTSKIVAGLNCLEEHKKTLNRISNKLGCGDISVTKINGENYTLLEEF